MEKFRRSDTAFKRIACRLGATSIRVSKLRIVSKHTTGAVMTLHKKNRTVLIEGESALVNELARDFVKLAGPVDERQPTAKWVQVDPDGCRHCGQPISDNPAHYPNADDERCRACGQRFWKYEPHRP